MMVISRRAPLLLALLGLALVQGRRGVVAPPAKLEPPPVAEHLQWLKPMKNGKRGSMRTVQVGFDSWNQRYARVDKKGEVWVLLDIVNMQRRAPRPRKDVEQWNHRIVLPVWRGIAWYAWKTGIVEVHPTVNEKGEPDLLVVPKGFYEKPWFGRRTREQIRLDALRKAEREMTALRPEVKEQLDQLQLERQIRKKALKVRQEELEAMVMRKQCSPKKACNELRAGYSGALEVTKEVLLLKQQLSDVDVAIQVIEDQKNYVESKGRIPFSKRWYQGLIWENAPFNELYENLYTGMFNIQEAAPKSARSAKKQAAFAGARATEGSVARGKKATN